MTGLDPLIGRREIDGPDDMEAFGERIGGMLRPGDLVVLTGALGAGKTTLTRGIAAGLGVRGPVQSPTFVIARTHPSLVGGAPLVHVDAYRLGVCARTRRPRHRRGPLGRDRRVGPRHGGRHPRFVVGDRARTRARWARCRHDVRRPLAGGRRTRRRRSAHRHGLAAALARREGGSGAEKVGPAPRRWRLSGAEKVRTFSRPKAPSRDGRHLLATEGTISAEEARRHLRRAAARS